MSILITKEDKVSIDKVRSRHITDLLNWCPGEVQIWHPKECQILTSWRHQDWMLEDDVPGSPLDIWNGLGWMKSDSNQTKAFKSDIPGPVHGHQTIRVWPNMDFVAWHRLDIPRMSIMSCKCQDLNRDGHARFWPKYDFLMSHGRQECLGKVRFRTNVDIVAWHPMHVLLMSVNDILCQIWRP